MQPEQIQVTTFGHPRHQEDGDYWWFDPAPVPRDLTLDPETQLALSNADAALGRLSGVGGMLREPRLLMRPYAVREALASARIEGTQASLTDVFQAEASRTPTRERDIAEVSAHVDALERGFEIASEQLSVKVLCEVHRILMEPDRATKPGESIRSDPVWLGSPTQRPETAIFVPPVGDALNRALADWEDYLENPPRVPALIRAALLHYQFLTIHPFVDGNGRTGRMLVLLFLRQQEILSVPLLYVSPYFANRRREYYDRLQAVRERGEIQQWLQFFLTAVAAQADDGVLRSRELLGLRERYRAELAGTRSRAIEVVETLFMNPIVTSSLIRKQLGVTNQGALNLIRSLASRGWLTELGVHGKGGGTLWLANEVFAAIAGDESGA
ncbi:Fic family protein [Amycolatopsis sp. 195334CR]|uniref:Fic family protein n=1 Tax=Amycolatopsis sp. 195334CR TaxID=2814588 RepID=UPI001A8CF975|nr:Fic/DOC family N-terminal domain-containing protein [Amycolatopsis sp. 195334CR]MBN6036029.1 Fic family protein [Amycolatopsis sp. 195334CR]